MKVYAVEHNLKNLLLVDNNNRVINGAYTITINEDGSASNCMNNIKSYFVMDVPEDWLKNIKRWPGRPQSNDEDYDELWGRIDRTAEKIALQIEKK